MILVTSFDGSLQPPLDAIAALTMHSGVTFQVRSADAYEIVSEPGHSCVMQR